MALKSDGTVWAWGYNRYGQLGDGTTTDKHTPVPIPDLSGITAVTAGGDHSLALKYDDGTGPHGTVWAWGDGDVSPFQVEILTDIITISAGVSHSLAVKLDGTVWAWGSNENGQLGDGTTTNSPTPVQVSIATGLTTVKNVSAGGAHSLALRSDGTVWAWGWNSYGQLGDGTTTDKHTPIQVRSLTGITAISAGHMHSIISNTSVWAWGRNNYGQLGDGTTIDIYYPHWVYGLSDIITISSGNGHSLALKGDGTVWSWGWNYYGQLGLKSKLQFEEYASAISDILYGVTDISAGFNHSLAVKFDGTTWAWGCNEYGQLGDGMTTSRLASSTVLGLTGVENISAGNDYSLALKTDGTVWSWGSNAFGQLGDGTTINRLIPVQIYYEGSVLTGVTAIDAGNGHSLALREDGTVLAWGWNWAGQLGDGTTTDSYTPIDVKGLTGVIAVSAGCAHSLALKSDGTVWAWGYNEDGELGDGTTENKNTPVPVIGLSNVVAISAGWCHSLAVKGDGTVWAWGWNHYGQLGDGTQIDRPVPVKVSSVMAFTGVIAVSAGGMYSLALKGDGTVWSWGLNDFGQLGDGTTYNKIAPVQVYDLNDIAAISAGFSHSLALKRDGMVWSWGFNDHGQLGLKYTSPKATVDFKPKTLSTKSNVNLVTAYIELSSGYDVRQIDVSTIRLNKKVKALETPTAIGDYDYDRIPDLMVKFERVAILALFKNKPGVYMITITGKVGGVPFDGTATIRII